MLIFDDERTDTTSEVYQHSGGPIQVQVVGYDNGVKTEGTLNGMTVTMSIRQDELPYKDLDNGIFTEPSLLLVDAKPNSDVIFTISGQSGNFGVSVSILT